MIILPAIDLLGGNCVRLVRGAYDTASKVAADALETARAFQKRARNTCIWSILTVRGTAVRAA